MVVTRHIIFSWVISFFLFMLGYYALSFLFYWTVHAGSINWWLDDIEMFEEEEEEEEEEVGPADEFQQGKNYVYSMQLEKEEWISVESDEIDEIKLLDVKDWNSKMDLNWHYLDSYNVTDEDIPFVYKRINSYYYSGILEKRSDISSTFNNLNTNLPLCFNFFPFFNMDVTFDTVTLMQKSKRYKLNNKF